MQLEATELTADELALQREVREFLDKRLEPGTYELGLGMTGATDPDFSRDLGARGWLGMALSSTYGGHDRTAVERLIVVEELLARGAPVSYHWIADRQSGPSIQKWGTEEQRQKYLPGIASGELSFAIGMSEPDSGSDLASLRTKAEPTEGGWVINGTKIWTTGALTATHILALFRTSEHKHEGLTQFIVDRNSPGLTISPIPFIDGSREFCELSFENVFIPDSERLGDIGTGWAQNTGELVLERGGVDRWMSAVTILEHWAADPAIRDNPLALADLGSLAAKEWAFHGLSLSIARMVDEGKSPVTEAALVKEMATRYEQDCVEAVLRHWDRAPDLTSDDPHEALLARALLVSPSWSIRGGTNEILRTIISKGLASA
ncbi:MAG: acyl-CoA dehydrogenase [Nocardioidaceae bacterium]|nr:acyl-CoA dehydrogenase [Nocardioidaceae bacterium]